MKMLFQVTIFPKDYVKWERDAECKLMTDLGWKILDQFFNSNDSLVILWTKEKN